MAKPSCIRRPSRVRKFRTIVLPFLLVLLGSVASASVSAAPKLPEFTKDASTSNSFAPQAGITLRQATDIAKSHTNGGRVLSADRMQKPQGAEYRVRVLVDGERVVTFTVDSAGQVRQRR